MDAGHVEGAAESGGGFCGEVTPCSGGGGDVFGAEGFPDEGLGGGTCVDEDVVGDGGVVVGGELGGVLADAFEVDKPEGCESCGGFDPGSCEEVLESASLGVCLSGVVEVMTVRVSDHDFPVEESVVLALL